MKFVATPGALFDKEDAQEYGEYLHEVLPRKLGRAPTTEEIVEDARKNPRCPYREYFEWDPKKGHHLYLLVQARNLINHIAQVTVIEGERRICRAFFPVQSMEYKKKVWAPMSQVRQDPALLEQVIHSAYRELRSWNDKYQTYASLREATSHVSRALKALKNKEKGEKTLK